MNVFPAPQPHGEAGYALEPLLAELVSAHPANILAPAPDTHPGLLGLVAYRPKVGTYAPRLAPSSVVSPDVASAAPRGLLWGVALCIAAKWLDGQVVRVANDTNYKGEAYPTTAEMQLGRIVVECATACTKTADETRTNPQCQPLPLRKRAKVQEPEDKEDKERVPRWKIIARSRAGKRVRAGA